MMEGAVFVQTNEPENAVIAFGRTAEGELSRLEAYRTGGAGEGEPHLPSQGSVVLTGDGRHLLVTNAASDDVSLFAVADESRLELLGPTPAGTRPRSVAEHDGLVYVLATGVPSVSGFRLTGNGLDLFDESNHPLEAGADPAQVGFSADGSTLVVSLRGTDSIVAFAVQPDGGLGSPQPVPSSGPTPYGFGFTGGGTLVVTEAFRAEKGAAAASSYAVQGASVTPVTKSVANGRSEICWAVVSKDNRYAFTTNFADGAVSCYGIGSNGELTLVNAAAGMSVDGRPGRRDEGLTADGRFLYALDADAGRIFGWALGEGGMLSSLGSWDGLPPTVAGLAAS